MNTEDKLTEMHADFGEMREVVNGILTQTRETNGRVTRLDRAVFGDVGEGWDRPGLVKVVETQARVIDQHAHVIEKVDRLLSGINKVLIALGLTIASLLLNFGIDKL